MSVEEIASGEAYQEAVRVERRHRAEQVQQNKGIDISTREYMARLTEIGMTTSESCSGHVDEVGRIVKWPYITWNEDVILSEEEREMRERIWQRLLGAGGDDFIGAPMSYDHKHKLSSHPGLAIYPFDKGVAWSPVYKSEIGGRAQLLGLWNTVGSAIDSVDKKA